jgi:hypothetical protein
MFMQIVIALLVVIGITFSIVGSDRENPLAARQAQQEVDNLRGFTFAVDRYIEANDEFEGKLDWAGGPGRPALNAADTTPVALRAVGMPQTWRAVAQGGEYVLCAPLSEAAIALLSTDFPAEITGQLLPAASPNSRYIVFASAQDAVPAEGKSSANTDKWAQTCDN